MCIPWQSWFGTPEHFQLNKHIQRQSYKLSPEPGYTVDYSQPWTGDHHSVALLSWVTFFMNFCTLLHSFSVWGLNLFLLWKTCFWIHLIFLLVLWIGYKLSPEPGLHCRSFSTLNWWSVIVLHSFPWVTFFTDFCTLLHSS